MSFGLRPKNPWGYRWLWGQTALLTIQGLGRVWNTLRDVEAFINLTDIPLWLWLSVHLAWGVVFAKLTWGIWRRKLWAIQRLWPILLLYWCFSIAWLAWFAQAPGEHDRLPFLTGLTLVVLGVNGWVIQRRPMRLFFSLRPSANVVESFYGE